MRRQLLLAYGIAEWSSAIDHLHAMQAMGMPLSSAAYSAIRGDLRNLIATWKYEQGVAMDTPNREVIAQVRAFLTEHQTELDQLLAAEGG